MRRCRGLAGPAYGLLQTMMQQPSYIQEAQALLADLQYTGSGADSVQSTIMSVVPELRNAYLKDL